MTETDSEESTSRGSKRPPGCIVKPTVLAAIALAGGIYLLTSAQPTGGQMAGGIVLIFVGALLSIPLLVTLVGLLIAWYVARKLKRIIQNDLGPAMDSVLSAGRAIIGQNKALYDPPHEFRDAGDDDFSALDRTWYDATTAELETTGYRPLGDIVDVTIEQAMGVSTVIRRLISADGTTMVGLYHVATPDGHNFRITDLETEFTDGTFHVTTNSGDGDLTTPPPQIHANRRPGDTPLAELLQLHEAEKTRLLATRPGVQCIAMHSADDLMASQRRQQEIKANFRKNIGYVDPAEVARIADASPDGDEMSKALIVKSVELAKEEEKRREQ
jgi:hypothetical protein